MQKTFHAIIKNWFNPVLGSIPRLLFLNAAEHSTCLRIKRRNKTFNCHFCTHFILFFLLSKYIQDKERSKRDNDNNN